VLILGLFPEVGQQMTCQNCGNHYQLIWLFPPELGPIEEPAQGELPLVPEDQSGEK
jgi:hypothetical protein